MASMSESIRAIYENGVFKPLVHLNLPEHQQVQLIVEPAPAEETPAEETPASGNGSADPLAGIRTTTGIPDLAENFDNYRFGKQRP